MDYQNREGGKTGSGGILTQSETNAERRERMRRLAMETIDLSKDPYFMKNHLGSYECRLCLTLHTNEGSYLAHTQGKKHSSNLARRAAREAKMNAFNFGGAIETAQASIALLKAKGAVEQQAKMKPHLPIIGRPQHKLIPLLDPITQCPGVRIQVHYPQIDITLPGLPSPDDPRHPRRPAYRIMSCWEQKVEKPDRRWQYVVVGALAYETIAIKIPAKELDTANTDYHYEHWDSDNKLYTLQLLFRDWEGNQ